MARLVFVLALALVVFASVVFAGSREETVMADSATDFKKPNLADLIAEKAAGLKGKRDDNDDHRRPGNPHEPPKHKPTKAPTQPSTQRPPSPTLVRTCNSLFDARESSFQLYRSGAAGNLTYLAYEAETELVEVVNSGIETFGCCSNSDLLEYYTTNYAPQTDTELCGFDFNTYTSGADACAVGVYHTGACFGINTNLGCYYEPTFEEQAGCIALVTDTLQNNIPVAANPPDYYLLAQTPQCVGDGYDNTVYRQADGSCNNVGSFNIGEDPVLGLINFRTSGMANSLFSHEFNVNEIPNPTTYITSGPNPREVSVRLFTQTDFIPNPVNASGLAMGWINFFVHDFMNHANSDWQYPYYVPVPEDDPLWSDYSSPGSPDELYMILQATVPSNDWTGTGFPLRRNAATAWFDLSQVYGADLATVNSFRTFEGGLLNMNGLLLPDNIAGARFVKNPFFAGDYRVNFHPGLTGITTVWALEHNNIATRLAAYYPSMTDEQLFQTARLITTREMVQVHELEWSNQLYTDAPDQFVTISLVELLNPNTTVNQEASLVVPEEFVSNYKWHTWVNPYITLRTVTGEVIAGTENTDYVAQFQDTTLIRTYGVSAVLVGLATMPCGIQRFNNLAPGMQNIFHPFLTSTPINVFSHPSCKVVPVFDFMTTDIIRDREHGTPKYNAMRQLAGQGYLPLAQYFDDLADTPTQAATLADLYQWDINNVDAIVGSHGEHLYPNQGFPLTMVASFIPFVLARVGIDRFYTTDFTPAKYTDWGMERIASIDFAQILCDNGITCNIPNRQEVFHVWDLTQMGTQTITPTPI